MRDTKWNANFRCSLAEVQTSRLMFCWSLVLDISFPGPVLVTRYCGQPWTCTSPMWFLSPYWKALPLCKVTNGTVNIMKYTGILWGTSHRECRLIPYYWKNVVFMCYTRKTFRLFFLLLRLAAPVLQKPMEPTVPQSLMTVRKDLRRSVSMAPVLMQNETPPTR